MFVAESGEAIVFAYPNTVLVSEGGKIFQRVRARTMADFRSAVPQGFSAAFNDPWTKQYVFVHRIGNDACVGGIAYAKAKAPSQVKVEKLSGDWETFGIFRTPDGKYILVRKKSYGDPHLDSTWGLFIGDQLALHKEEIRQVIPLADGSVRIYARRGELFMPGVLAVGKVPTWNSDVVSSLEPDFYETREMGEIAALVHPGLPAPLHS